MGFVSFVSQGLDFKDNRPKDIADLFHDPCKKTIEDGTVPSAASLACEVLSLIRAQNLYRKTEAITCNSVEVQGTWRGVNEGGENRPNTREGTCKKH